MTSFCQSFLLLVALSPWGLLGELRAAGVTEIENTIDNTIDNTINNNKEKSAVPVGYEEAAQPKQEESKQPQRDEADSDQQEVEVPVGDVPTGYEEAGKAGKRTNKARGRIVVPAVPVAGVGARALAKAGNRFADNPQLQALIAQMRQQLKPFFAVELSFAETVCRPNAEQLQKMKALATPELEQAIRAMAIQQAPQMGIGGFGQVQQESGDLFDDFEKAASRIVASVFPDETVAIYEDEQNRRREFRARAGAIALVAHLDTQFRFSPAQRQALTDSCQQQWQRSWQHYLQIMASNPQFFPPVPDEAIVPHLNDVQVKQWKSQRRQDLGFHWQNLVNRGLFQDMQQEIDWFENPERGQANRWGVLGLFERMQKAVEAVDKAADDKAADEEQAE